MTQTQTQTTTIRKALSTAINSGKEATITVYRDLTAEVTYGYGVDHLDAWKEVTIPSLNWVVYSWPTPSTPDDMRAARQTLIDDLYHAQCKLEQIRDWLQAIASMCTIDASYNDLRADVYAVKEALYAISEYKMRVDRELIAE